MQGQECAAVGGRGRERAAVQMQWEWERGRTGGQRDDDCAGSKLRCLGCESSAASPGQCGVDRMKG